MIAEAAAGQTLPGPMLWDDFETGDARMWSLSRPAVDLTVCVPPAAAVELTSPQVLGDGTPGSVTRAAIQAALDLGGQIAFAVGAAPVTIVLDQELVATREVVLDGGGVVTLSGGDATRVLRLDNPANATFTVTLQHLGIARGATPAASGAGVFKPSGGPWQAVSLVAVDCSFTDGHAIATAQDDGGGAIYVIGLDRLVLVDSSYERNSGSNGGAVYSLGSREVLIDGCTFRGNSATGVGGNPGNGGNAGAVGVDGAARTVRICGSRFESNQANAFGAAFFSVMYDDLSLTEMVACTFDGNANPTDEAFAGGAYLQGGPVSLRDSTFRGNQANGVGALYLGPDVIGDVTNCTFTENVARQSLAGAISIGSERPLAITNCTIVGNQAPGEFAFAAGINVGATNALTLRNTILADNTAGNVWNPWNIIRTVGDGGGNLQWPPTRPNGQAEVPATATVTFADPLLAPLSDWGGITDTVPPSEGSPAVGLGVSTGAPAADQRGRARTAPVDAGAYETP